MSKGSKRRPEDSKKITKGWAEIDWKNTRRNKVQKMHGIEIKENEFPCQSCKGKGKSIFSYVDGSAPSGVKDCTECNATGKISYAQFRRQLGIACEKCGKTDALIYHSDTGVCGCHHTHRI